MKCSTVQERIHSLVGGDLPAWEAWRVKRHCALCPACQSRRDQAEQLLAGLHRMATMPTPERVRAAVFAQLPAIEAHSEMRQDAAYHMQVSLGLDAAAQRRYAFRRLVRVGAMTAAIGLSGLLIAPHVIPDFPDIRDLFKTVMWDMRDLFGDDQQIIAQVRQPVYAIPVPANSPERDALIVKAKRMRQLWKPWAIQQKPLMRKMLWGDPKGFEVLLHLYQDLPAGLPESGDGLTLQVLNADGLPFTWQPAAKLGMTGRYNPHSPRYQGKQPSLASSSFGTGRFSVAIAYDSPPPLPSKNHPFGSAATTEALVIKTLKHDYDTHRHDIELSRSTTTGATYYSLWVSGCVSETTQKQKLVGGQRESYTSYREIYPAYEELTR